MVRIDHTAPYFMPLFCSNRPSIVITSIFTCFIIFLLIYIASHLMANGYDDPEMFRPNSQDYFRTSLLGFLSPFLFFFIKTFIFNINHNHIILNLLFDFPVNDWFLLCILIALAYPQLQEPNHKMPGSSLDNGAVPLWHIIPRQSFIFGLTTSLAELFICLLNNLSNYRAVSVKSPLSNGTDSSTENSFNRINTQENPKSSNRINQYVNRNNITLSKCVNVRSVSSTISSNVYSSDGDKHNYGSINANANQNQTSKKELGDRSKSKVKHIPEETSTESLLVINPVDNSLRLTSSGLEEGLDSNTADPIFYNRYGYAWVYRSGNSQDDKHRAKIKNNLKDSGSNGRLLNLDSPHTSYTRNFCEITSGTDALFKLWTLSVILISNIFLTIGESFILSICFIYVTGHEDLFTDIVNYFGLRSLTQFLLYVVLPFSISNFIVSVLTYFFKDLDDLAIEHGSASDKTTTDNIGFLQIGTVDYSSRPNDEASPDSPYPSSLLSPNIMIGEVPTSLLNDSIIFSMNNLSSNTQNEGISRKGSIKAQLLQVWSKLGRNDIYILGMQLIWGIIILAIGVISSVAP